MKQTLKNEELRHNLYTLLGAVHLLDDKTLTEAFHILFDKDWKKYRTEQDKAREIAYHILFDKDWKKYQTDQDKAREIAYHILFDKDKDWKKYWTEQDKARKMRSIFNGETQPCRPFKNWVKCIEYLSLHCA